MSQQTGFFLQNRHDQISVQLARSKSLATNASFTDYAGNSKQILKIMEDKENKRVLNKCQDFHCTRIARQQSEAARTRSLTLQVKSQVKKRRQTQPYNDLILTFKHLKQPR